ncbi:MAG TPA: hypothetical protein EYO58_09105 [Flavobacteriales bacterium]|nr:hypothetical protein [Flavobacteriales bacterium]
MAESRERQALAHLFIQPIKEVYNEGNWHYVVSSLATGGTLEEWISERRKEDRPMNEQQLMSLFAMILLGMEETHAQGQLHRNVSSAHVYLDKDSQIARLGSHANTTFKEWWEKCYNKVFKGEWYYLSPLASEGKKYAQEDDIWALGVLFAELATLQQKPKDEKPLFTAEQVTAGEHLNMVSHFSSEVHDLFEALLQVDEAKRPTIHDILQFPAVTSEVNKLLCSTEFNEKFDTIMLHKLNCEKERTTEV